MITIKNKQKKNWEKILFDIKRPILNIGGILYVIVVTIFLSSTKDIISSLEGGFQKYVFVFIFLIYILTIIVYIEYSEALFPYFAFIFLSMIPIGIFKSLSLCSFLMSTFVILLISYLLLLIIYKSLNIIQNSKRVMQKTTKKNP